MHAIRLHEFGPAANLRDEEVDDPKPDAGQVRIAVGAAGVHFIDTMLRAGRPGPLPSAKLPSVPGREVAGVVDAVGPGVDAAWLGRRVVAHLGAAGGGYAELAVAEAGRLHALADGVADDVAVAMIGTGRTTMGILDAARLGPDDVALVSAAAGGIGCLLVQAALAAGAMVVGLAGGPAKVERVAALGAGVVAVDYDRPGWEQAVREAVAPREVTVAFDGVGGARGRGALELLGAGGRLLVFGSASGELTPLSLGDLFRNGLTVSVPIGGGLLQRPGVLGDLEARALAAAADGSLVPLIQRFPLAEAAGAHVAIETRATTGKVVLVP